MTVYGFDPLSDARWPEFVSAHPDSSVFHTAGWLRALHDTYGYRPIAFTTTEAGPLSNAVVFCEVQSWLTGRRLVSLPFSDHCQPLADGVHLGEILDYLQQSRPAQGWKYIEIRPAKGNISEPAQSQYTSSTNFSWHNVDLRPDLDTIYRKFHLNCIRRRIKRADQEGLVYERGTSEDLLKRFGDLFMLTRRRHKVPPQPASWFRNITGSLGSAAAVHVMSKGSVPVASILTLAHRKTLVYKYSCSDANFHQLGGVQLLLWKVIQHAKETGLETFDLGRSDHDDDGLIVFKERLGGIASQLTYQRCPVPGMTRSDSPHGASLLVRSAVSHLPDPLFAGVGQLMYRHMA